MAATKHILLDSLTLAPTRIHSHSLVSNTKAATKQTMRVAFKIP